MKKVSITLAVDSTIKPATPWNVTLAKLVSCEERVGDHEKAALEARWEFGRELLKRRVAYKGRSVVPADLMKLTIVQCAVSRSEVEKRIRFAERVSTKSELRNAVTHFGSWHRIVHEALVAKKRAKKIKKTIARALPWTLGRLNQEVDKAITHHAQLSRDQVQDIEALLHKLTTLLGQIDQNDAARSERRAS